MVITISEGKAAAAFSDFFTISDSIQDAHANTPTGNKRERTVLYVPIGLAHRMPSKSSELSSSDSMSFHANVVCSTRTEQRDMANGGGERFAQ